MKNCVLLFMLFFFAFSVNAQTKNGTIFSEHESIDKTKAMWTAFQNGDQDAFVSYFTDSLVRIVNGDMKKIPRENLKGAVKYWGETFENLEIKDAKPAAPDAIEYKKGGTWVQDWLLFTGTHIKSGINIDVQYHNLYILTMPVKLMLFISISTTMFSRK